MVIGGSIATALLMAPGNDAEEPLVATSASGTTLPQTALTATSASQVTSTQSPSPLGSQPAAAAPKSPYERTGEMLALTRQAVEQMGAIVDRPSAEAGFPKVVATGRQMMVLVEALRRDGSNLIKSSHDKQIDAELMVEMAD